MKKLESIYATSDIVIRTKVPQVRAVLVIASALVPLIMVSDFIAGDRVAAAMEAVMWITLLASLVLLYRGRFRLASMIPLTFTTAAIVAVSFLIEPQSRQHVQSVSLYMIAPVIVSLAVGETEWHTLVMSAIGTVTIVLVSYLIIAPALPGLGDSTPILEEVVVGVVVHHHLDEDHLAAGDIVLGLLVVSEFLQCKHTGLDGRWQVEPFDGLVKLITVDVHFQDGDLSGPGLASPCHANSSGFFS